MLILKSVQLIVVKVCKIKEDTVLKINAFQYNVFRKDLYQTLMR